MPKENTSKFCPPIYC